MMASTSAVHAGSRAGSTTGSSNSITARPESTRLRRLLVAELQYEGGSRPPHPGNVLREDSSTLADAVQDLVVLVSGADAVRLELMSILVDDATSNDTEPSIVDKEGRHFQGLVLSDVDASARVPSSPGW